MLHDCMDLSRLRVHPQQVEENRKRKHTRARNRLRKAEENFSRKSSLKSGVSPCLRRDSPTNGIKVYPRVAMILILSPELLEKME